MSVVEQRLDRLHKTIMAAAKPPCQMLVSRKLNKNGLQECWLKLDQAKKQVEEMLKC